MLAPTETVNVDNDGRMFVSDRLVLVDMWFEAPKEEKNRFVETGSWKLFKPGTKGK